MHGLVSPYECERRDGVAPVSSANQAAAFDSISRSSRRTRFSRRSRVSSSRSVVLKPSLRSPSSSAACLTHLRIALAVGSNSRASWSILRPARASSTIRRRYSGAYGGWVLGIGRLLLPFSPTPSTKAGQVHEHGVSEATFYVWKKKYSGLALNELRELRQLREENGKLKRLVADLSLDRHMLQEIVRKKL